MKPDIEKFVGKVDERHLPVSPASVPEVYMTSSGWGIRCDAGGMHVHASDGHGAFSMPPEHWRYTVLNILHLTEGHWGEGFSCDECPKCAALARAIRTER